MSQILDRVRAVLAPAPLLSRDAEAALTARQQQILDELSQVFDDGFAHLTMVDLAARLNCSLRTLYGLAPSRDELVMIVVDRNLRSVGRTAHRAIPGDANASAIDAVRNYLSAATVAVGQISDRFAQDMEASAAGQTLNEAHSNYLVDVTECLLDEAIAVGEIGPVDTAAVARMIAGLGRDFSRPEVMTKLRSTPKEAADAMVDVVLAGLRANP